MWIPARSQHSNSLFLMAENLKTSLANSGVGGMLLTDSSKAFDCLKHDLLIKNLAAWDLSNHYFVSYLATSQAEQRVLK